MTIIRNLLGWTWVIGATMQLAPTGAHAQYSFEDYFRAFQEAADIRIQPVQQQKMVETFTEFHRFRIVTSPFGYENDEWFNQKFLPQFQASVHLTWENEQKIDLQHEVVQQMETVYKENQDAFREHMRMWREQPNFPNISNREFLDIHATLNAKIFYSDPDGWRALVEVTGIFPACMPVPPRGKRPK